ncbi:MULTISPECIES: HAMP domain-containing sensor histidine kinase [Petrotoga]|uniref:histidine kinase n=2 Tax=Petrotoga sibirica TaxID=156202 RepID=A0A4V3GR24_9BACT|nr:MULTISPECIES: HAMP domain-containing sensor histidine kinase [Petrotoga]POZ88731.1 histidine kinase [Petrotoga sibirica DSM 13575]POZ90854.1 histidine kinase [Petrotoga sp. SL27]TDX17333.1 phospho-acceptor domain-containing protein [Petrotoga sibirica]
MQKEVEKGFFMETFQEMVDLFQGINWDESEKDFLTKLLKIAIKIIPEAEYGSIWLIKGALYEAIVGIGYDEDLIKEMVVPFNESYVSNHMDKDLIEVQNILNYNSPETDLYKISKKLHKETNQMVTLISALKNKDNVIGHIYIDSYHVDSFDDNSKKMLRMFSNLASIFLTLKILRDSEKETVETNSNYLSFISHELRTPLTSIIGFAETILNNEDLNKDEIRSIIRKILFSTKHMNSLLDDISTFNKLNKEKRLNLEKLNLKKLLYQVLSMLEPTASPDVEINLDFPLDMPVDIETDETKLNQVLVNVIGNAMKYTTEGSIDIRVGYESHTKHFLIEVKDTGPGIPEDKLKDIFRPFFRVSKDKPGSGLGLAIVKKNLKMLKGSVEVKSKIGKGTTFLIKIPQSISGIVDKS